MASTLGLTRNWSTGATANVLVAAVAAREGTPKEEGQGLFGGLGWGLGLSWGTVLGPGARAGSLGESCGEADGGGVVETSSSRVSLSTTGMPFSERNSSRSMYSRLKSLEPE